MDIKIDNTQKETPVSQKPEGTLYKRFPLFYRSISLDLLLAFGVALVSLIPRILMALQLDMVTDEVVYILGGKIYLPLLLHFNISSPQWRYNYEHPPFVKLLIGFTVAVNTKLGHLLPDLFAARLPSIVMGTLLVVAMYWLGRAPFGRVIALVAALSLAVSPWLVYFSGLAYLDMTMTALISIAFLLVWHAVRRPRLYVLIAVLVGLAAASKYTAVLAIPGMVLYTLYYFFVLRWRMPKDERPAMPWLWWLGAIICAPLVFLASDPAIWTNPLSLLQRSFDFEINHSARGHLTFLAGQYSLHVPQWAILYIVFVKISAFVTIPAVFFVLFVLLQQVRFYLPRSTISSDEAVNTSFLFIWLVSILGMFSLLNIVVGTHYHLPIAAPITLAGAYGLATLFRYGRGQLFTLKKPAVSVTETAPATSTTVATIAASPKRLRIRAVIVVGALAVLLIGPHLVGLVTVRAAEGYTSEFFQGENAALQVAYPGYRDGVQWLATHTTQPAKIGLVALSGTLNTSTIGVSWYDYNKDLPKRFTFTEVHPTDAAFPYDYLIWPMHLIQRGYAIPGRWKSRIVSVVMGGKTIYCYILARFPSTVSP